MPRRSVVVAAAVLALSASSVARQATQLVVHAAVERSIAPGAVDEYTVQLRDGECAAIRVDQKGVDVIVRTFARSGAVAAETDDVTRKDGRKHFTIVADGDGAARFTISGRYARFDPGSYAVWIDEISDRVTRTVMTRYYTALARGEGRGAARGRVQLAMLADKSRHHPFYWAGLIQAGDWTPIR